ncbi:hypothetical protein [Pseudoalteromonas sp. T1lg23B]|nr:hypothetical protein [Pseudoalteromonas sp. T1lg23B]
MTHQLSKETESKPHLASSTERVKHHPLMALLTLVAQKLQLEQAVKVK